MQSSLAERFPPNIICVRGGLCTEASTRERNVLDDNKERRHRGLYMSRLVAVKIFSRAACLLSAWQAQFAKHSCFNDELFLHMTYDFSDSSVKDIGVCFSVSSG
jgi:hypothetical protein